MNLTEKYRPRKLTEIVGQPKVINMLNRLKPGGRAFYITGPSGTGKTSIAKILARQVADQLYIREVVARQLKSGDLKEFAEQWATTTMFGQGYAMIINESHGLRRDIVEILLDVLERMPDNVTVIFTTTRDGADLFEERCIDAGPFASRCILVNLETSGRSQIFAKHLKRIARQESLDGRPIRDYKSLIEKHHYNFRAAIQEIETGAMLEQEKRLNSKSDPIETNKLEKRKSTLNKEQRSAAARKAAETRRRNAKDK
jgi:replication-associated recombination protein RarA